MTYTLITGASSGLGEQFAKAFAQKGRNLILAARSKQKLEQIAQALREKHAVEIHCFECDLSHPDSAETLFKMCQDAGCEVDLLINNAGVGFFGNFEDQDIAQLQDMLLLNTLSLTKLTYLFLAQLKINQGRILNVASTAGLQPVPHWLCYAATKAYVLSFSLGLRFELKDSGVGVTTFAPGPITTPFFVNAGKSLDHTRLVKISPEDAVKAAIYGLEKGQALVVPGWLNKLLAFMPRLSQTALAMRISSFLSGHQ